MSRVLVTTAWPYGNGPIHLGHLAGSYLPADIYARYRRLAGDDVVMVSGTDMHGTPITLAAEKEGVAPGELAERYHREIKDTLERVGVSYDLYTRTSTDNHVETAQEFFATLRDNRYIYEDSMLLPYCPEHGEYLPDRYVEGTCPRCGFEDARGDQCDECGLTLDAEDLENPRCALDGAEPEFRKRDHFFFRLSNFQDALENWIEEKEDDWRPNVYGQTTTWLNEGLEDRPISRDMEYGVPVPGDEEGRVMYVWFEAVMGYLSATKQYFAEEGEPEGWRKYWDPERSSPEDPAETYYFIAKDNIPFHTILWPAMLMGHGDLNLPKDVPANEYLNLEGAQFSTSRGHAIWVDDFLQEFDADQVRYAVASMMPERRDSNFKLDDFQRLVNDELIATYGNFVHRVLTMIHTEWGEIPEHGEFDERDESLLASIEERGKAAANHLSTKEFREALNAVMVLARRGNRYLNETQPWKQSGTRKKTTLFVAANIVKALAVVSEPFLPHSARKIWRQLGLEGEPDRWEQATERLDSGTAIPKPEPLFDTVEDEDLEPWSAIEESETEEREERTEEKNDETEEDMDRISFDEFQKLDVRIGEVLEAAAVEGSDKLLKLLVDIGEEERQVVAGIRDHYAPEELVGTEVVILVNLEPATIFGVESDGMLLAAGDGHLLRPDRNVDIGSRVA